MSRTASVLSCLTAVIGTSLAAGPAVALTQGPCVLPRTDAHHSEGTDSWNTSYPRPLGTRDALMVFLSFPDHRPQVTTEALVADHFPITSDFFERASYSRFDLRVHPMERWVQMPADSVAYGIERDWEPELRGDFLSDAMAAANRRANFGAYDVVYLVADPDAPGVDSDATKVVNFDEPMTVDGTSVPRIVTVFEQHPPDQHVLAHETGHVFDLPDLYHRPEGDSGDWDTYVGDWDLMGSQFGLAPDLFGWHKWKLGWLGPRNIDCVPSDPGESGHILRPLGAPAAARGPTGTRLVVVRTGPFEAVAIEARTRVGNDAGLCRGGVLLYRVRADAASADGPVEVIDGHPDSGACQSSSVYPPLADAALRAGQSHTVGERGGVRVEVVSAVDDGGWRVRVTREAPQSWSG
ncbi:M6 family metalloprotease domain-containing protein [Streptomyces oceani]|uniref:Peptidase M6 n=1 Tax=Streptomyces oceani TaxID=1075402 RepID=A0A1E7KFY4_9ACTN|nr:M6 family metalloprotease domain-containing protein [Streptomyces oceani]OEV02828.1 peptidase M6 [Streptomyces oceani]